MNCYERAGDFLLSTHFWAGLRALSVRCGQPIQQQGRRMPSFSSEIVRCTWFCRVAVVFTLMVQHIHSLRARGVISSQAANALGLAASDFRKSAGNLCAVPSGIILVISSY